MAEFLRARSVWAMDFILKPIDAQHMTFIQKLSLLPNTGIILAVLGNFCKNGWNFESKIGMRYGFPSNTSRRAKHELHWEIIIITKRW